MATPAARTTFAAVPPEAADVLRPALPGLADEMIAAISIEVPDYARAMEGTFGQLVRMGVEVALNRFIDMVADPGADVTRARDTYVNLGRGEFHAGRSLDALLAAYRVGARLAWRRFVDAGTAGGLPPDAIYSLGEAIFAYIDEISAESADGYAEEQSAAAGESQRRRRRLIRLLAQDPPASQEAIRTAAQAAAWALPRELAVLVAAAAETAAGAEPGGAPPGGGEPVPGEEIVEAIATRLARRLGGSAIGGAAGGLACVFVPDPDAPGRRRQIVAALDDEGRAAARGGDDGARGGGDGARGGGGGGARGARGETAAGDGEAADRSPVAIGPTVPWHQAGASLRRAAAAYRLAAAGGVDDGPLVVAEQHLATLLLAADRGLAADLAASRLAPLAQLADGPRARLTETLRAWLDRPGQVQAVAAELGVHPQTVRYRLRQLRELFGTRLEDPEARFELSLALRVG
jgi:DNA-binding transcriptional ArsR family regulator